MPVEQIEANQGEVATCRPADAGAKGERGQQHGERAEDGALPIAPRVEEPWPDAPELAPEQEEQPESRHTVECEDHPPRGPPLTRLTTPLAKASAVVSARPQSVRRGAI